MLKAVGIGDSWGAYIRDTVGVGQGGLFDAIGQVSGVTILNCADAGDSSEQTSGLKRLSRFRPMLPGCQIIFVSTGGDDIAGDQFRILIRPRSSCGGDVSKAMYGDRLLAFLAVISADLEEIMAERDTYCPDAWIVTHEYDRVVPSQSGQGVLWLGPWMSPGFHDRGWDDPTERCQIANGILAAYSSNLQSMAKSSRHWIHVPTQGTCAQVFGGDGSNGWANEMHLNAAGFNALAQVINAQAVIPILNQISPPAPPQPTPSLISPAPDASTPGTPPLPFSPVVP